MEIERESVGCYAHGRLGSGLTPGSHGPVRVKKAHRAGIRLLRIRDARLARRRVEGQVVEPPIRREHDIGRDVAVTRFHHDEWRLAVNTGTRRTYLPTFRV